MALDVPEWLIPKESFADVLTRGLAAGSQVAGNRLRAQAMYAQAQQQQQHFALQERQLVAQNERYNLQSELARTKMAHDAEDFATLREWWPKLSSATGEDVSALEVPQLHNPDTSLKISALLTEKQRKQAMANFASGMSNLSLDKLATPEGQKEYLGLVAKTPEVFARLGIEGVLAPMEKATRFSQLKTEVDSKVEARKAASDAAMARVDALFDKNDAYREHSADQKRLLQIKSELATRLADSRIDVNDAQIQRLNAETEAIEKRRDMAARYADLKEKALNLQERRMLGRLTDTQAYRLSFDLQDLDKKALVEKWTPQRKSEERKKVIDVYDNPEPAAAPATTPAAGKVMVIKDGKKFMLPASQLDEALKQGYEKAQ